MAVAGIAMVLLGTALTRDYSLDEASLTSETESAPDRSRRYSPRRSAIVDHETQQPSTPSRGRDTTEGASASGAGSDRANLDSDDESLDDVTEGLESARTKVIPSPPTRAKAASSSTGKTVANAAGGHRRSTSSWKGLTDGKPVTTSTTEQATEKSMANSAAPPPRLLCVFGNWTGVDTWFPEDGLCDYAFFDALYRGRPQEADVARLGRPSAALRRFRHNTRRYRSTLVGIAFSFSGLRKATKDMQSSRGEPYMRDLWKDGVRHAGVLDFVPGAGTTEAAVERLFRFLQLCRRLQDKVIPKTVIPRPSVALGMTFSANTQRQVYASIEKHLRAGWSPSRQKIDMVVLRTHLSGRDDVNPSCTITGSSLWGRTLADYQPSLVDSLNYMEKKLKLLASESAFFVSMSVAARRYVPAGLGNDAKAFDLGSRCRPFDETDYAREIDSFASVCGDSEYVSHMRRDEAHETMHSFRLNPRSAVTFDTEDTIFAKMCKARQHVSSVLYGLALFDAEFDDGSNECSATNKYGNFTLVRAARRALEYVDGASFTQRSQCTRAP
ncbi:hypothetical protein V5799_026780 [Amblyomma americanum]|uniref:Chitinase n=1 Tax=Amblyomma americanum TaxID=6943 RepID=A0AAQ4DHK7_AMBAM